MAWPAEPLPVLRLLVFPANPQRRRWWRDHSLERWLGPYLKFLLEIVGVGKQLSFLEKPGVHPDPRRPSGCGIPTGTEMEGYPATAGAEEPKA
ncbi:MAG: hypothetical protein M3488_13620 [Actinomycetota bacterium]|nr:hypothetical protein [Actinomycetota bacterium]